MKAKRYCMNVIVYSTGEGNVLLRGCYFAYTTGEGKALLYECHCVFHW